jgi:hypothetical protein
VDEVHPTTAKLKGFPSTDEIACKKGYYSAYFPCIVSTSTAHLFELSRSVSPLVEGRSEPPGANHR